MPAATPPPCREPSPNRQKIIPKSSKIDENRVPGGTLGHSRAPSGPDLDFLRFCIDFASLLGLSRGPFWSRFRQFLRLLGDLGR